MNAPVLSGQWRSGNRIRLLENGDAFFPRVIDRIAHARREILLETFILFDDAVGARVHAALLAAARRGVHVEMTVDGYGSPDLPTAFVDSLTAAGVVFRVFEPVPKLLSRRLKIFRRMHRKILVVDGECAFIGGINFSADHLASFGPRAKQDYAVEIEGPLVADILAFTRSVNRPPDDLPGRHRHRPVRQALPRHEPPPRTAVAPAAAAGTAEAILVVRDNRGHRTDIERHYRTAIRSARRELIIANAYFFPGYRLLRDIRDAARRGLRVSLIVKGEPDMPIAGWAPRMLYRYLIAGGVRIHEYCERPFHGKVALADDRWATVGSSNLDPLSLSLNLEANVFIRDRAFNRDLRENLDELVQKHCREVDPAQLSPETFWRTLSGFVLFHFLRRFPAWAGLVPAHTPRLALIEPPDPPGEGAASGLADSDAHPASREDAHSPRRGDPPASGARGAWLRRGLLGAFLAVVAVLLFRYARSVDWPAVGEAVAGYDPALLAAGAGLTVLSYAVYSVYDLLGRNYTGHDLATRRVLSIAAVSYAFNLSLGSLIGAVGFRYRLYSRLGLDAPTITRILGFSIVTNWLGYTALAGGVFALGVIPVPTNWTVGNTGLRILGALMLLATIAYPVCCGVFRGRTWTLRGHEIRLPSVRLALLQLVLSTANWLLIAGILFLLLNWQVGYASVLGVFLLSAIAGIIVHIPAGLGVIETVFITLLGGEIPEERLLAAILVYRAIYYLAPLLLALVVYARFEAAERTR